MDNFQKIKDYLSSKNMQFREISHEKGATAEEYHQALGCTWEQQGKCLLIKTKANGEKKYYIFVIPANKRADMDKLAEVLAVNEAKMATQEELLQVTGCNFGELPPLASLFNIKLLMDKSFLDQEEIYMSAGSAFKTIIMSIKDLVKLEQPIEV